MHPLVLVLLVAVTVAAALLAHNKILHWDERHPHPGRKHRPW